MESLNAFARSKLSLLERRSLRRELTQTERREGVEVLRGGRRLVSFSCNDYLGLAHDARVKEAAIEATRRFGAGAGGSRLITGNHPLLEALEAKLARWKGKDAALVFGSGYLANLGIPPALVGPSDLVMLDELSHACMLGGARLSGAQAVRFRHNDLDHLSALLGERRQGQRALIMTERVFSMDGDRAPIQALQTLAERSDAWLMVDNAHALGVLDPEGEAPLEMGTLSKALGSYGGYLCASQPVVELLRSRARSFVYSTGLPPASAAAAIAALDILEQEPERAKRPLALARRFTTALGLPPAQSAIVPIMIGDAAQALALSADLEDRGYLVVAIRPPTVPLGSARLRVTFSAAHSDSEVDGLASATGSLIQRVAA